MIRMKRIFLWEKFRPKAGLNLNSAYLFCLPSDYNLCSVCHLPVVCGWCQCLAKSFALYSLNSTEHVVWERNEEFFTEILNRVL